MHIKLIHSFYNIIATISIHSLSTSKGKPRRVGRLPTGSGGLAALHWANMFFWYFFSKKSTRKNIKLFRLQCNKLLKCLTILWLCILTTTTTAQTTCLGIFQAAQTTYKNGNYKNALQRLQEAETCDFQNKLIKQRQALQNKIFNAVEQQRIDAENAKQDALYQKQKADSSLQVAEQVLDKMYFYEGKFGLTLKNVAEEYETPQYRYGFINKKGEEVIPFEWETATPFSTTDGFARVQKKGGNYLLDTIGKAYLVATSLEELTPQTQALDLHKSRPDSLPHSIGVYSQLEIILCYGEYDNIGKLKTLPNAFSTLSKLTLLKLDYNQLRELPETFGQLSQLQSLDLSSNLLSELPETFGQLPQLQDLDLYSNELSELPETFGQLPQLQTLDLSSNQLSKLPEIFGQLSQLQDLDLSSNQLSDLPETFGQLSQLQTLNLRYNQLSDLPPPLRNYPNYRT